MSNNSYKQAHADHAHQLTTTQIDNLRSALAHRPPNSHLLPIIRTLSDKTRLSIYLLLHQVEELSVTDICSVLDLNQSTASHALADLKKLGLVVGRRCGQLVCYSLKQGALSQSSWLQQLGSLFEESSRSQQYQVVG